MNSNIFKSNSKAAYTLAAAVAISAMTACSPDSFEMGGKDVTASELTEGNAFSITHDSNNHNIVYLKSLMDSRYQVSWIEPQGRSQSPEVTLQIPFPGTYDVLFGVQTRGGVVYGDTAHFTVNSFYSGFVDNVLYTNLTGGVGKSKTWIPDNGNYGLASGDISYGDPALTNAEYNNFTSNWDPGANHQDGTGTFAKSSLTFDLIDGAHAYTTTYSPDGSAKDAKGSYLIDTDNYRLNLTDVQLLHSPNWDNIQDATGWAKDIHIVTLTDNQLRLGILRNPDTSGQGKWWIVFNFVSKDYADNYKAPEVEVYPTMEEGWRDFVEPKNDKVVTYRLTGFDWYKKDGTAMGVTSETAIDGIDNLTLTLNSGDNTYTFNGINGNTQTGSYSLTNDGIYTFKPALPTQTLSTDGRAKFRTNSDGTMRILGFSQAANCDARTGGLSSIVWGSKENDDQGKFYQYQGYQLEVVRAGVEKTYKGFLHIFDTGWNVQESDNVFIVDGKDADYTFTINGSCESPYGLYLDIEKLLGDHPNCSVDITDIKVDGKSISFDNSKIERSAGDQATTARRYIVNPWGATAGDAASYKFSKSLAVSIHVKMDNGKPFAVKKKR